MFAGFVRIGHSFVRIPAIVGYFQSLMQAFSNTNAIHWISQHVRIQMNTDWPDSLLDIGSRTYPASYFDLPPRRGNSHQRRVMKRWKARVRSVIDPIIAEFRRENP